MTIPLKDQCLKAFLVGLEAVEPARATATMVQNTQVPKPQTGGRLVLAAIGKAAIGMAQAAMPILKPARTLIVTNHQNTVPVPDAIVLGASHPMPDAAGQEAAKQLEQLAQSLTAKDVFVVLISGGASALLPAPVSGVPLDEKILLNGLLLASGADITQVNIVRQALSRLKGGKLAQLAAPAKTLSFIISDVVGDDLRVVASGPTQPPIADRATALQIVRDYGLETQLPQSILRHLTSKNDDAPPLTNSQAYLVASNRTALGAISTAFPAAKTIAQPLVGDVADAAAAIYANFTGPPGMLLFGGETTVQLSGKGKGGRNQEMALRVAALAAQSNRAFAFLSGGTDGLDGPTDAAGGLVDDQTIARLKAAGIDIDARLANNDSYPALKASGDLLITGPTGTNVADLQILCLG